MRETQYATKLPLSTGSNTLGKNLHWSNSIPDKAILD